MRIFILTLGTRGDVEPLWMLGRELQARGHAVVLGSSPFHCAEQGNGVPCVAIGDGTREQVLATIVGLGVLDAEARDLAFVRQWTFPQLMAGRAAVSLQLTQCDYLITNIPLTPPRRDGRIIAGAFVSYEPPLEPFDAPASTFGGRILPLVAISATLLATDAAPQATGFWKWPTLEQAPDTALRAFAEGSRRLVVLTMGSMTTFDPALLMATLIVVLERLDLHAVVVGGWSQWTVPDNAATRVLTRTRVDYDWLFARAVCVLHHGGSGTVGAVLRAGVPAILLPQIGSQQRFAAMLRREGVCTGILDTAQLDVAALEGALHTAMQDAATREAVRKWQTVTRAEHGLQRAADRIELHAATQVSTLPMTPAPNNALVPHPSEEAIATFYHDHPELFAQRRLYTLLQVQVSVTNERSTEINAGLQEAGSIPAWLEWLMDRGIVYTTRELVGASEEVPGDLLAALRHLRTGDVFPLRTEHGPAVIRITAIEQQPVTLAQSKADITAFLINQRLGEQAGRQHLR